MTDEVCIENRIIADRLREMAMLLEQQGANHFRVAAYRNAAKSIETLPRSVRLLLETNGIADLTMLPAIGPQIAAVIAEMVHTGESMQLERLRGAVDPVGLLSKVPGIGPTLAMRIVEQLHIDTLEELEQTVYNGRLGALPGFGERRLAMVRAALAEKLGRGRRGTGVNTTEPPIDVLLDVDREYRDKAAAHKLRLIAPRRFNPKNEAWLPILHTQRGRWRFTALYSNTPLAHRLNRTRDWVVIYFHTDSDAEGQRTVVTETRGQLRAKRVVRGREAECADHHRLLWSEPPNVA